MSGFWKEKDDYKIQEIGQTNLVITLHVRMLDLNNDTYVLVQTLVKEQSSKHVIEKVHIIFNLYMLLYVYLHLAKHISFGYLTLHFQDYSECCAYLSVYVLSSI